MPDGFLGELLSYEFILKIVSDIGVKAIGFCLPFLSNVVWSCPTDKVSSFFTACKIFFPSSRSVQGTV